MQIRNLIRANRPGAKIIVTLSPLPLMATFRPVSCLTASSVSKAILRVAIDQLMRDFSDDPDLFYFPSLRSCAISLPIRSRTTTDIRSRRSFAS